MGGNQRDSDMLQGAVHLRPPSLVDAATRRFRVPVVGAPVGIEGTEEALRLDDLL